MVKLKNSFFITIGLCNILFSLNLHIEYEVSFYRYLFYNFINNTFNFYIEIFNNLFILGNLGINNNLMIGFMHKIIILK